MLQGFLERSDNLRGSPELQQAPDHREDQREQRQDAMHLRKRQYWFSVKQNPNPVSAIDERVDALLQ